MGNVTVIKDVKSDEFQKKLALKAFFGCAPYKELREEIDELVKYSDFEITKKMSKPITSDELAKLNFEVGVKSGLFQVLNILENLKEELEDNSLSPSVKG